MFMQKVKTVKEQVKLRLTREALKTLDNARKMYGRNNNIHELSRSDFINKLILDHYQESGVKREVKDD